MILKLMFFFCFLVVLMQFGGDARPIKFVYRHLRLNGSSRISEASSLPVGPKSQNRALFLQYVSLSKWRLELMIPQPDSPLEVNLRFFFPSVCCQKSSSLFGQIMS